MKKFLLLALLAITSMSVISCSSGDDGTVTDNPPVVNPNPEPTPNPEVGTYAKGADVSWVTQMENAGRKFYDKNGKQTECMTLMKSLGVNSIRLRVWVNPANGWNGKEDVLKKALRAKNLGLRLMIDFHYSDSWADPGKQPIPAAWKGHSIAQLKDDVATHTKDVLQTLKDNGISVEWIQVGNETNQGMLWDETKVLPNNGFAQHQEFANFTGLVNAGYDAAKSIYPDAKVIVHTSNGHDANLFTWMYDALKKNGAKYDVIGMSLYPEDNDWQMTTQQCLSNIRRCISTYGKEVMVCEVGMAWDAKNAAAFMKQMVEGTKAIDKCLGVFYWEPQCYNRWNGYTKGAFDNSGKPTAALDAFLAK